MKNVKIERVNDGKGWFLMAGKTYGSKNVIVTVNGIVWLLNVEIGRLFSFTIWEKDW